MEHLTTARANLAGKTAPGLGISPAHFKPQLASLGRLLDDVDRIHPRVPGTLPAPADHRGHVVAVAFEQRFHPPVGKISYPAGDGSLPGALRKLLPEEDALDASRHPDVRSPAFR